MVFPGNFRKFLTYCAAISGCTRNQPANQKQPKCRQLVAILNRQLMIYRLFLMQILKNKIFKAMGVEVGVCSA